MSARPFVAFVLVASLAAAPALAGGPPPVAPAKTPPAAVSPSAAEWVALWREALEVAGPVELVSHGENGYRLLVTMRAPRNHGATRAAAIGFQFSEIDTERDEPGWTKPRAIGRRGQVPVQIAVAERGVYWLPSAKSSRVLARIGKSAPMFGTGGGTGSVVVRPEFTRPGVTCFLGWGKQRSGKPLEICLAAGLGVVAVKGVVPELPDVVFARPGLLAAE